MGADDKSSGLVQGTLYMLILKTLALEPMRRVRHRPASPADQPRRLSGQRRLAVPGAAASGTRRPHQGRLARDREQPPRQCISLTTQGRAKLKQETRDWEVQTTAIHRILRASLGEL